MTPFVPLRISSEYSISNSIIRLQELVDQARQYSMTALALTDQMNMFAAVKFYRLCRENGIKPILGVNALFQEEQSAKLHHLILLAKDEKGYLSLCRLLSRAYLRRGINKEPPHLDWSWLQELEPGHLIALSAAQEGVIGHYVIEQKWQIAEYWLEQCLTIFQDNFYLEVQRFFKVPLSLDNWYHAAFETLQTKAEQVLQASVRLAKKFAVPVVATHPVQFMQAQDFIAHEVKTCITEGQVLANEHRPLYFHPCQYFVDDKQMHRLFADIPSALENNKEIAKRCSVNLVLGKTFFPVFKTPDGESHAQYLEKLAKQGLIERMKYLFPAEEQRAQHWPLYEKRLQFELHTIIEMGFACYFLIVADFINWAKHHDCPVGPGRGSGAGSLVAYSLNITELNPIEYALLFERFLNPERISMPDFDVDFCQENRYRVIDYVRSKYGEEAVSQIVTFGTMSSKAVIRDVGRVLGLSFSLCDRLSKLIPVETNRPVSLQRAMTLEPDIERIVREEEAEELIRLSLKLEDLVRNTGMHAGGVLMAPGKLSDFCPIYKAEGSEAVTVSMYDKDDVEAVGLVKFDFLGLRNLTILKMAQDLIAQHRGEKIDIGTIPLDDPSTFNIFQDANTTSVFQFESLGMKRMLLQAQPSKFEEIIAFVALYRPGPMDLIPDFIRRMHGEAFKYLHPSLEKIIEPTYGVMVYQEQVMQAAQACAGYTLGQADILRRAMGKKKVAEMEEQRSTFLLGAEKKGIDRAKASEIFDYMAKFAGYGFNKSHAAAYALLAYQTAWLKAHYLVEFMCVSMSSELGDTDQLECLAADIKKNRLQLLPPNINRSYYCFMPEGEKSIRYALGAIKGAGKQAIESIVAERESRGPFRNLFDFCRRLNKKLNNKRMIESLVKAGAFDELESNRAYLFNHINLAMNYAEQGRVNDFQSSLFDLNDGIQEIIQPVAVETWNFAKQLSKEKEAIGFYISDHPFKPYRDYINHLPYGQTLAELHLGEDVWIGGFINKIKNLVSKSGKRIWLLELDDGEQRKDIRLNETQIEQYANYLHEDMTIFCQCRVKKDAYGQTQDLLIVVKQLMSVSELQSQFARCLCLTIHRDTSLLKLYELLEKFRNKHGLALKFVFNDCQVQACMHSSWKITLDEQLIRDLQNLLSQENVQLEWLN